MLDEFRQRPKETLSGIIARRQERDAAWQVPASIRMLQRVFLSDSKTRDRAGALALRLFGIDRPKL
jgi:hypothetical protein